MFENSSLNTSEVDCYNEFYKNPSTRWTFVVMLSIFMLFTLVGNGLVCVALVVDKSLRTPANIFLVNMSLGDIFVAGTIIFTDYVYLIHFPIWRLGSLGNWIYNIGFVAFLIIPFLTLVAVTCDRYLSIIFPFKYTLLVTKKRAFFCVLLLWLYTGTAVGLVSALVFPREVNGRNWEFLLPMNGYYLALLVFHTLIPLIIILLLYSKIYKIALRHRRQINALTNRFGERGLSVRFMKSELKATRTVLIVVVLLACSWLPFIVNETVALLFPASDDCASLQRGAITNYVTYLNGAINPVVYSLRHRRFFVVFKKILCCKRAGAGTPARNVGASVMSV